MCDFYNFMSETLDDFVEFCNKAEAFVENQKKFMEEIKNGEISKRLNQAKTDCVNYGFEREQNHI